MQTLSDIECVHRVHLVSGLLGREFQKVWIKNSKYQIQRKRRHTVIRNSQTKRMDASVLPLSQFQCICCERAYKWLVTGTWAKLGLQPQWEERRSSQQRLKVLCKLTLVSTSDREMLWPLVLSPSARAKGTLGRMSTTQSLLLTLSLTKDLVTLLSLDAKWNVTYTYVIISWYPSEVIKLPFSRVPNRCMLVWSMFVTREKSWTNEKRQP